MEKGVSVLMICYNQEKYISRAIESVLAQKTNFPIVIFISDDCSTDTTPEIIKEYANQFPELFKVLIRDKNVGVSQNTLENYQRCTEKYIALLEGDDYWIDENKLQKQFDFMEANPQVALCFTNACSFIDGNEEEKKIMIKEKLDQNIFDLDHYLYSGRIFMPTLTIFIRKNAFPDSIPDWLYNTFNLDWAMNILFMQKGKAGYIDEITAMYRKHKGGIILSTELPVIVHNGIRLAKNLDKHFDYKYHHVFGKRQWRYNQLVLYYFEKKKYLSGFYWLVYTFFRNPIAFLTNSFFLKTLYKVIFQGHEV
jgi:glycosyltransferase involved in cell wall biosynthesis